MPMRDASGHSLLGDNQGLWQQQVKLSLGHWLLVASFLRRQLVSLAGSSPAQAGHRECRVPDMPDLSVCAGDSPA